jgi:photosystem II stability/assembly factor-like uncharacterized protein
VFDFKCNTIFKFLIPISLIGMLAACSSDDSVVSVFDPSVAPPNVQVVAGDGGSTEVENTVSWTQVDGASDYVVYWSNIPGVTDNSSVVVPADDGLNYVVHSGIDVLADNTYYYRVQAVSGAASSELSAEVTATPQQSVTANPLNDVAWNGADTLVAVGDSGVILNSTNALTGAWSVATSGVSNSLAGVAWSSTNGEFLVVGAGGTILRGDGSSWSAVSSPVTTDLEDVIWLGDRYIAVGKSGTIMTSSMDGSAWTPQNTPATATTVTLGGVASNGTRIVAVGTMGTILTSDDSGVTWIELSPLVNNELNDVSWDGNQFVAVGSDDTILVSADGASWSAISPGTSDINFVAVTRGDATVPTDPVLATVGSSGDFVALDTATVLKIETGTSERLSGIAWVDDGATPGYFVLVGNDGTVLTNQYQ